MSHITFELSEVMAILLEQKQSGTLTCLPSWGVFFRLNFLRADISKEAKARSVQSMFDSSFFNSEVQSASHSLGYQM